MVSRASAVCFYFLFQPLIHWRNYYIIHGPQVLKYLEIVILIFTGSLEVICGGDNQASYVHRARAILNFIFCRHLVSFNNSQFSFFFFFPLLVAEEKRSWKQGNVRFSTDSQVLLLHVKYIVHMLTICRMNKQMSFTVFLDCTDYKRFI